MAHERVADLRSAPPPPVGPDDHVRGDAPTVVIEYGDYECPYCARTHELLVGLPVTLVFRHFPVVSKHPRSERLARAAEAAGLQGAFWEMHASLFGDPGRLDDPHLWDRVARLGLDLDRFERERRSDELGERVARDFRSGVRAGVTSTPTLFVGGMAHPGLPDAALLERLRLRE
jgi:protein-disulfide isomerase